jgi:hypothetical protein
MTQRDLAIVEWHDGTLSRVEEFEHGVRLHFSIVFVYRALGGDEYDIEECQASLELVAGSLRASMDSKEISDCELDGPCKSYDVQSLLSGIGPGRILFVLTDGSELSTSFQEAKLYLREPFLRVEHWSGPLVTQETK